MPDFDTRRPQEPDEPNGLGSRSLTNRVRNSLIANRLRTLLIGGGILLFAVVGISVGLVTYSFGGPGALPQEPLGEVPNGQIAFLRVDRDIYVTNPDGTGVRNLTKTPGVEEDIPAWSPDGEKIAFATFFDTYDIYVMNADGSGTTNLTETSGVDEATPAWSPDGERIAFKSGSAGNAQDIYVMNADGTGRMRLSNTAEATETNPTWSPDGEKIAFWSSVREIDPICVINADGTGRRCVAYDDAAIDLENGPGLAWGRG